MHVPATPEDIAVVTDRAIAMAPFERPPTQPPSPELLGAPQWYPFELAAWELGESARQGLVKHPALKRSREVLEAIMRTVEFGQLRRGRQPFVMCLGFGGAKHLAPRLAVFISDPDIDGHVIGALSKMKAWGYSEGIKAHLESRHAWVRRAAQRYLDRSSAAA